jgi:hypothetical protein
MGAFRHHRAAGLEPADRGCPVSFIKDPAGGAVVPDAAPEASSSPDAHPAPEPAEPVAERAALIQARARRDECLARKRDYKGRSTHVRRKLDAALRAAESDVAILLYALGENPDAEGS